MQRRDEVQSPERHDMHLTIVQVHAESDALLRTPKICLFDGCTYTGLPSMCHD